jgi:hypothetical protein
MLTMREASKHLPVDGKSRLRQALRVPQARAG